MKDIEEGTGYWTFLNRKGIDAPGIGKWKIKTFDAAQVFASLRAEIYSGALLDVCGMKMRSLREREMETVYVYVGPYNDLDLVGKVAAELFRILTMKDLPIEPRLDYKTDLQTFWQKEAGVDLDLHGKPEKWNGTAWLYRYDGTNVVVNDHMLLLHKELENGSDATDPYFKTLFKKTPKHLFPLKY
jgi:hypothetical protein